MDQVKMRHPNLKAEITVPESAVPIHMASGWMPVEDTEPAAATAATSKPKTPVAAKDKE